MGYGIPYQGSKQDIIKKISSIFPKADNFIDLFGGGGSVTHYMVVNNINNYRTFYYNEINPLVVNLFEETIQGKYSYDIFKPPFISREEFEVKKNMCGYVKYLYSFSNKGSAYLFGKNIETYKRSLHNAVVFGVFDEISKAALGLEQWPNWLSSIKGRRLYLRDTINDYRKSNSLPVILHQFLSEDQLSRLEQLERLEQLQKLEDVDGNDLIISNLDYRSVIIPSNSIIYCDIPYKSTTGYGDNQFDHAGFYNWTCEQSNPVYISEYNIEDPRFECVLEVEKRKLACGCIKGKEKAIERVYRVKR